MHRSLGASLKQLTRFFDVQKNLTLSLENNNINTYIHPNDREPVQSEPLSPSPIYSVTFSEFDEKDSPNQKNNNFTSGFVSFNSLSNINNLLMLFSSVFSQ
jgi:hypothetical protein